MAPFCQPELLCLRCSFNEMGEEGYCVRRDNVGCLHKKEGGLNRECMETVACKCVVMEVQ